MSSEKKPQDKSTSVPVTVMNNLHAVFPSLAMVAGIQLNVFTILKDGSLSAEDIAGALGVREEKLAPLLYALVVAGLLYVEDGVFSNTRESDTFLVNGRPEYLGGFIEFYKMLWNMTQHTADSIRTGIPQARFNFQALPAKELEAYFRKQVHSSMAGGEYIGRSIDFSGYKKLLDAGGGTGGAAIALCAKYRQLQATVADLPNVVKLAPGFIAEAGMSGRIDVSAVDLCSEPLKGEYDAVLLRAVLQTFSKENAMKALKNISRVMPSGGVLFIVGSILENTRLGPMSSLAYSLVFLNTYDNGNAYTEDEYRAMLIDSGFTGISITHDALSDGMGIVSATKV